MPPENSDLGTQLSMLADHQHGIVATVLFNCFSHFVLLHTLKCHALLSYHACCGASLSCSNLLRRHV